MVDTIYVEVQDVRRLRAFILSLRQKQQRQALYTEAEIEARLRSFLRANEPKTLRMLLSTWDAQRSAITQADLVRAAGSGSLSQAVVSRWQGQYADFVNNRLTPIWRAGGSTAATFIEDRLQLRFPGYQPRFPKILERIDDWIDKRGGELIVGLTDSQRKAVNAILRHYTTEVPLAPAELAKVIRPVVGLTPREAEAVRKRREQLINQGFSPLKATEQAARYAATLHRVRANRIARTELASAFNQGNLSTIKQGIEDGDLLPDVVKVWNTAEDERVCPICRPLNGDDKPVEGDDTTFTSGKFSAEVPPIHPSCRCTIIYEIDPEAQLELTRERDAQDMMLTDDELKDHDEDTYGNVDWWRGERLKPDGKRLDEAELLDALENVEIRRGEMSSVNAFKARKQLNRLCSEFGAVNKDVLWSSTSEPFGGRNATRWQTFEAGHYLRKRMQGSPAAHSAVGKMWVSPKEHNAAIRFLKGSRTQSSIDGFAAVVHEAFHGSSVKGLGLHDAFSATVVDEFTTESAARYVMQRKFGVRSNAGYIDLIPAVRKNLVDAVKSRGRTITEDQAADILNRASILFKRLPPSKTTNSATEYLNMFVDTVPDVSEDERQSFASELRDLISRSRRGRRG